jgi:hypothetical protein
VRFVAINSYSQFPFVRFVRFVAINSYSQFPFVRFVRFVAINSYSSGATLKTIPSSAGVNST